MQEMLAAMLQSPAFLFHFEPAGPISNDPTVAQIDGYALSDRLASFLWRSVPDGELLDLAEAGALRDPAIRTEQARRMLSDDRGRRILFDFFRQWFELGDPYDLQKDPEEFPNFDLVIAKALYRGLDAFVDGIVAGGGDGRLATLFTSRTVWVNERTAPIFGLTGISGSTLQKVETTMHPRAGLLTQPAFLASHAGPSDTVITPIVKRGRWVRKRLMCDNIPPPPADTPDRRENIAFMTIGGLAGAWRTNECLHFSNRATNDFLISLTHAIGVPRNTVGQAGFCSGPIQQILV